MGDPPLDLDMIDEACATVTDAPWFVESVGEFGEPEHYHIEGVIRWNGYLNVLRCDEDEATAEFIAAARTWVPALVAELRIANERGDGWREQVKEDTQRIETLEARLLEYSTHGPPYATEIRFLKRERDEANEALRRVVANESNHYDRYWNPPDTAVSDAWLEETEAKMRDALEDVFCDDAAAVMLTLIAEIRRARAVLAGGKQT